MKTLFALLFTLGFSTVSFADIFDRIDSCERSGGGSCVYNLLRELARAPSGPALVPASGAYKRTSGHSDLCDDQYLVPVLSQGRLSQVKIGWCGTTYNKTYDCTGSSCGGEGTTIEIIDRTTYQFVNNQGKSGIFGWSGAVEFTGPESGVEN